MGVTNRMSSVDEKIARLSPEKLALLAKRLQDKRLQKNLAGSEEGANNGDLIPHLADRVNAELSYAQQRLWFLDQLEPGSPSYIIPAAVRLEGKLDVVALENSLAEVVRRHDILRTTFISQEGAVLQAVHPFERFDLPVIDLSGEPEAVREETAQRLIRENSLTSFNLAAGPLFVTRLIRLAENSHILLLCMHHIISDGWSMGVLVREISELYAAQVSGRMPHLPELTIQYADFADWQRGWLQGERMDSQLAYWKKQLSGVPGLLELPTDFPRPAVESHRGAHFTFRLPGELSGALREFCKREDVTLFMALLAAFEVLLFRSSGQEEFCVGTPIANRSRQQVESLIGFFVNTLAIRARLHGELSFREALRLTRETCLEAYSHQDLPFEVLVDALQIERSLSYSPVFQVMFALEESAIQKFQLPGLSAELIQVENGLTKFDLTLTVREDSGGLSGIFEYSSDLFTGETIQRMTDHFCELLTHAVAHPETAISRLPMLTAVERALVLNQWSFISTPADLTKTLPDLVDEQAEILPDFPAVRFEGETLTYAGLQRRSNQLARALIQRGLQPGELAAVLLPAGPELVISLLAVQKAGGAFLPIDPDYPPERLAYMIEDSQVQTLLTRSEFLSSLPEPLQRTICLDADEDWIAGQPETRPEIRLNPDDLAYVIYTSGSTGRPKGSLLRHRGLSNLFQVQNPLIDLRSGDRALQFFSVGFDGSLWGIFSPLCTGATLYLAARETLTSPVELARLAEREGLTHLFLTPSVLSLLDPQQFPSLRAVVVGGEALPVDTLQRWLRRCAVINAYGPTEATIVSTMYPMKYAPTGLQHVPIGRPLPNTRAYVLDEHLQLAPVGVPGELYVGGLHLSLGYLNRPELTEKKFIPNPFIPGEMLYQTGDRARWLPDGTIDFLGRLDSQVKIRGFRIELGEIENVLLEHPGVKQAVAAVLPDRAGDPRLVGYIVPADPGNPPTQAELLASLKARLPAYMHPQNWVIIDNVPLSPSGKVDRRRLPVPTDEIETGTVGYQEPQTPTERQLAELWEKVLGTGPVGLADSFFDRGGHSLKAAQLVSRVREVFHVEYPLRDLFTGLTLGSMASQIDRLIKERGSAASGAIQPAGRQEQIPLTFAQQRLWFLNHLEPESPVYNIAMTVRLRGSLDIEVLRASLDDAVKRHASLRTSFHPVNGQGQQVIADTVELPFVVYDLRGIDKDNRPAEVEQILRAQAEQPFDLTRAPLMRASLLQLDSDEYIFMMVIHHIISDGWSISVLARELSELYRAHAGEQGTAALPELPIQYSDYAVWQRNNLQGAALDEQLAYWKETLSGMPHSLELPTDHPRPSLQSSRGANYLFRFDSGLSEKIKAFSQQENSTLFMILLAAYQSLLYRYTGQDDFAVGTPVANRPRAELEPLVGLFVNTLVLRANLSGGEDGSAPGFRALLDRVRETSLGAFAHQDTPFEALVDALQAERDLSRNPLFQVMFVMQNTPAPVLDLPGIQAEPMPFDLGVATFDLTLMVTETPSGLEFTFEYNTDLFEEATVARMAEHFENLLRAALAEPDVPVSRLPLLSENERWQVLYEWNPKERLDPRLYVPVHRLFQAQAQKTPDALALYSPSQGISLSYGELDRRVNQLAHHLRDRGVTTETLVALYLDRSVEAITAILAVLKAGGAYLPIDLAYPAERVKFMLDDSQAAFVLTTSALKDLLPESPAWVICLDEEQPLISQQPQSDPREMASAENLAYVIYTSGSTGKPKGVQIEHRSLVNHNLAVQRLFNLRPEDRMLQFQSLAFDAALEEIFPTLISGAALIIRPSGDLPTGEELLQWVDRWQITILDLPTAYWHALVSEVSLSKPPVPTSLRLVAVGGEKALTDKLQDWRNWAGDRVCWLNTYGPTEATIIATSWLPPETLPAGNLPIGKPIDNTRAYVLDRALQPVPAGVPGELFLAGVNVARGYLDRPELTAEKFLPDPFSANPSDRMYRTGDRARWLPNGELEYLGRVDFQVKVRGFRVEPEEIEAALQQCPDIRESVVVAREVGSILQLVAYFAPASPGETVPGDRLRDFLKQRLPDYMVPAIFVQLDSLPLTPAGKVDRRALPEPDQAASTSETPYETPESSLEKTLAQIWEEVLGRSPVGRNDNFFALGGDSILSLQVISRARQSGIHLNPRLLFEYPTIAALAQALASGAGEIAAVKSEQGPVSGAYVLTPIQRWFVEASERLPLANPAHWNQSLLLAVPGSIDAQQFKQAVAELAAHHDALRSRFYTDEQGEWQAEILPPGPMPKVETIDLSHLPASEQQPALTAACATLQQSFDLSNPPLLSAGLFWLGEAQGSRIFMAAHHLVVDTVSWRILVEDLFTLLEGKSLPPKTTSYRQWSQAMQELAGSSEIRSELGRWLEAEALPQPVLPGSTGQPNLERDTAQLSAELPAETTQRLTQVAAQDLNTDLATLLLSALAYSIVKWAGPRVVAMLLESHGRDSVDPSLDLSRTVGWFTSAYPLHFDLREKSGQSRIDPQQCLRVVKESLRSAPRNGLGYGLLSTYHPDPSICRRLQRLGDVPVSFNYLGQFTTAQNAGRLRLAAENRGPDRDPNSPRSQLLDVSASITEGVLRLEIAYNAAIHSPETIRGLVDSMIKALQSFMNPAEPAGEETTGLEENFNDAGLSQDELAGLLEELSGDLTGFDS